MDKIHVLGKGYEEVLLKYIDADSLPDFLGGKCTCSHMPGGCVPLIAQKQKDKYVATEQNVKVPTVYNTKVMETALNDELFCSIVPAISTTTTTSTTTVSSLEEKMSKVAV